jgi:hypothetical protein
MAGRLLLILPLDRMTALMVGAARTTEEKIHVHGLHNASPANPQRAVAARSDPQGSLRSGVQHANSFRDSAEIRSSMRAGASVPDRCLENEVLLPCFM